MPAAPTDGTGESPLAMGEVRGVDTVHAKGMMRGCCSHRLHLSSKFSNDRRGCSIVCSVALPRLRMQVAPEQFAPMIGTKRKKDSEAEKLGSCLELSVVNRPAPSSHEVISRPRPTRRRSTRRIDLTAPQARLSDQGRTERRAVPGPGRRSPFHPPS